MAEAGDDSGMKKSLYFVAVVPHEELRLKARMFSKDFAERFDSVKSYINFPHITIIKPFEFQEIKEKYLIEKFSSMELKSSPFEVFLDGYGSFKNTKNPTIYLKPKNAEEITRLYEEVQQQLPFYPVTTFHPHLGVAYRDLTLENFQKAWTEYESKFFEDSFIVDKVCLYKHFEGKWHLIKTKNLN